MFMRAISPLRGRSSSRSGVGSYPGPSSIHWMFMCVVVLGAYQPDVENQYFLLVAPSSYLLPRLKTQRPYGSLASVTSHRLGGLIEVKSEDLDGPARLFAHVPTRDGRGTPLNHGTGPSGVTGQHGHFLRMPS
ncbi:hypothetical protein LZ32DRAFT_307125 [Colletotrichum eremochloae]|nr:hypothetical protein LZ32DRAFT_307125 [Colletotrichum eremochloae]